MQSNDDNSWFDKHPLMKCGHRAQGTNTKTKKPACVICFGDPNAEIIDENPPSLEGRMARCCYYGTVPKTRNHEGPPKDGCERGQPCMCEKASNNILPFFELNLEDKFDMFYCGCHGWD